MIPKRLHGWDKIKNQFKLLGNEIADRIDIFSDKFGLRIIPSFIRYGLVALVCIAPCFAIIAVCIFGEDDEDEPAIVKDMKQKKNQIKDDAKVDDKKQKKE